MSQIAEAGFNYTELGPYGYYPPDRELLDQELQRRNLAVVAGFLFQPLHEPDSEKKILEMADQTSALLSTLGARFLVLIDHISEERMSTAGIKDAAVRLDSERLRFMIELIRRVAAIARRYGVMPVLHQHAGCYLEFEDELEEVLSALDPGLVGICVDTGHMAYAGIDAVRFYERHHARVKYLHFKDINPVVHRRVVENRIPFLEAVSQRIFCPLGKGVTDWRALRDALSQKKFDGYATIEQDVDPTDPSDPLTDARSSLNYLRSIGF
ncbi:MAG: TIM barrel protein [Verrucomicrobia bacterium]|nr:TIM barrel protein [Verrucomicrobiota bacterium]